MRDLAHQQKTIYFYPLSNRRAKFYELTAAGRKRFREETEGWNRLATAMTTALAAQAEEI